MVAALRAPHRSGPSALPIISGKLGACEVVVFHTGMGPGWARERLQQFWERHCGDRLECVIGAGFAGGLDPALPAGTLVLAENYPERVAAARAVLQHRVTVGVLASAPTALENPEAKAQWACATGAIAVDMETATVAAFFREKRVPFLALRAISDAAHEPLPVPSVIWFDARAQRPRPLALIGFLLRHPARLRPFVRFVLTIRRARRTLAEALIDLVASSASVEIL